jgi:hypothetical protein
MHCTLRYASRGGLGSVETVGSTVDVFTSASPFRFAFSAHTAGFSIDRGGNENANEKLPTIQKK